MRNTRRMDDSPHIGAVDNMEIKITALAWCYRQHRRKNELGLNRVVCPTILAPFAHESVRVSDHCSVPIDSVCHPWVWLG